MAAAPFWLETYLGQQVIADLDNGYLLLGRLEHADQCSLIFSDADLHDHAEANCTKDVYALESRTLGIRANRKRVAIPAARILAISLLSEVIT